MNTTEESEVTGMSFKTWVQLIAGLIIVGIVTLVLILALPTIEAFAPFLGIVIVVTLIVCVPGSVIFAAWYLYDVRKDKRIAARRFAANANNVYSAFLDERNGRFIQAINGPQPEAVPAHYSPSIQHHNDVNQLTKIFELAQRQAQIAAPALIGMGQLVAPARFDLIEVAGRMTSGSTFLGRASDGTDITVDAEKQLCHGAFNAVTGRGKTIIVRGIETQLLAYGHEVIHADIKFALEDEKGNDYRPLAKRIVEQGAISGTGLSHLLLQPESIKAMIEWLAGPEIARRLALYNQGLHTYSVLYLFLEELAYLMSIYPKLAPLIGRILVVGRSLGIKVFTAAQNFQAQNLSLNGGIKENFESAWFLGGDDKSGASLLDMQEKDLKALIRENNIHLGEGVTMFRNNTVAPDATLMRVGMASNDFVYHMLGKADGFLIPKYLLPTTIVEADESEKREPSETLYNDDLRAFQEGRVINGNFPQYPTSTPVDVREVLPRELPNERETGSGTGSENMFLPTGDDKILPDDRHDELAFWYRKNGNVNDALAAMGITNSRYRRHAAYLVAQMGLKKARA